MSDSVLETIIRPVEDAYRALRDRGHHPTHIYMHPETLDEIRNADVYFYGGDGSSLDEPTFYGLDITELPFTMPETRVVILDQRTDPRVYPGSIEVIDFDDRAQDAN